MSLDDAQSTVMSKNQTVCATRGTKRTHSIAGRLHDNARPSMSEQGHLKGFFPSMCTVTRSSYLFEEEEHSSRNRSGDNDMIFMDQQRSLGHKVNNLTQVLQLAVLVGDLLIKLDRGVLVPATAAITEHSTQSSSTLGQPDLAILDTACEVSISTPDKSAVAVAEDVVQVQIGLMFGPIGTSAEGLECHGVVVERNIARCFAEVASSRGLVSTVT